MKNKKIVKYYNADGTENKFDTYINNHAWVIWAIFIFMFLACGILESI